MSLKRRSLAAITVGSTPKSGMCSTSGMAYAPSVGLFEPPRVAEEMRLLLSGSSEQRVTTGPPRCSPDSVGERVCVARTGGMRGGQFVDKGGLASAFRPGPAEARIRPQSLEHRSGARVGANVVIYEGLWPKKASNGGVPEKGPVRGSRLAPLPTENAEPRTLERSRVYNIGSF